MNILVVTERQTALANFLGPLQQLPNASLVFAKQGTAALATIRQNAPAFVIVDEQLHDFTPLVLVAEIMKINAMVNTAVVSALSPEEFHEASEGLGILSSIPLSPGEEDGRQLATLFTRFMPA